MCTLRSFPKEVEWPGDGLEAGVPSDKLGELLSAYARPYSLTESRSEGTSLDKVTTSAAVLVLKLSDIGPIMI